MFSGDDLAGRLSHRSERSHRTLPVACIYNPPMDHHTLAAVSITGSGLDVLGSMYLAYDLLGGQSWTPALSNSRGHLLRRFRDWLRSRSVSGIEVRSVVQPIAPKVGFALLSIHGPELFP
jgi:hypothetical protein